MKKIVLILAVLALMALPAAAFDFGGSFDASAAIVSIDAQNATDVVSGSLMSPAVKATGWVRIPFGSSFTLSTEANYKYSITGSLRSLLNPTTNSQADLTLFKGSFSVSGLSVNVGRYAFSDVTGTVYSQTADGLNLSISSGLLRFGAYAGYTGLLNAKTSGTAAQYTYDTKSLYPLASKYVVAMGNVSAPNFISGNTFALEGTAAINLNGPAKEGVSDGYDRFYGTVSANGPITTRVYYSASATGSYLTKSSNQIGILGKGSVICYLPFKSLTITGKAAYGTSGFETFTGAYASMNGAYSYADVLTGGATVTFKPADSILCLLSGDVICSTAGAFELASAQWQALSKWQVLSDVSTFLSAGQVIPLRAADKNFFTISIGGTVSF